MRAALAVTIVLLALIGAAVAGSGTGTAQSSDERPNVLVIETDDQTVESMRVMPNVQRHLARKGATFTNSFVNFALCCPSRAGLLTGQYGHNNGILGNQPPSGGYDKLDHSNVLPVWLQQAGYRTIHLGKYLNGYDINEDRTSVPQGWSEWHGSLDPTTYRFYNYTLNENGTLVTYGANRDPRFYQTDFYARRASELIEREAGEPGPFFMWTAFLAPHSGGPRTSDDPDNQGTPDPAPRHRNAFRNEPLPRPPSFNEADVSDKPRGIRNRNRIGANRIAGIRENYRQRLESLLSVDDAVLSVLTALRESDQLDNTVVVFTSDNGFFHGEHRVPSGKVLPYEPSIRVPLVVRGPGVPRGLRLDQLVSNIDVTATVVDYADARAGREMDGRSLRKLFGDDDLEFGRDLLVEGPGQGEANTPSFSAIRTHRFVYVEYRTGDRELYDLAADPYQLQSRHTDPRYAGLRGALAERLANLKGCSGSSCRARPEISVKVRYRKGRTKGGKSCALGNVRLVVLGADRGDLTRADFYVDGRRLGRDRSSPFTKLVRTKHLDRGEAAHIRTRVLLEHDRVLTRDRRVRVCSSR